LEVVPQDSETWVYPSFDKLSKVEGWVHHLPSILKEGRLSHFFPTEFAEGEEEKVKNAIMEKDPYEKQLKSLKEDKGM
jgi:hypothetical protein